jgi:type II secretory ATPase GspE/PulE/Tfp pilus assembly ATPase PilB-like protein
MYLRGIIEPMPSHFDTDAEDAKLAAIHAAEEEDLAQVLAERYGIPYTDFGIVPINMDALRVISKEDALEAQAVAFDKNGKHISLAIRTPENDALARVLHEFETDGYTIEKYLISQKSFDLAMERYAELSLATESKAGVFDISGEKLIELSKQLSTLPDLREYLNKLLTEKKQSEISELFEAVLAAAFGMKASDIHIEPSEDSVRLRFRLDGVLTDVFSFDAHAYKFLNSRIKILSGLKLNITNRAQDGRFSVVVNGTEVEIRTSLIPGNYGESVVLRILDPGAIDLTLDDKGIHPKLLKRLREEVRRPNGMLLTTGPTGSGKTTTLYAFLTEIYTPDIKIITIEDPIEYHLRGIVQTQTNAKDYTFASGLRSILRQDPDVIMVGEIRDAEVAETAIQAALTGHFVLSTLHTNNAAGTFPRLADLGAGPKSFSSAVTVAMAQRLVRTLNSETRTMRATTDEEKKMIERIFSTLTDDSLRPESVEQVGAATANGDDTGYKGRTGLYEAIFMDEHLGEFLRSNPSEGEIAKEVAHQGYLTLAQDGVLKALAGITSLEEVFSVVDLPRD